jgi:hypothetical protein
MLLVEIILTIIAWVRGWKWWALLPLGIALAIGFFVGVGIASTGGTINTNDMMSFIWVDILAVIALGIMCFKKREVKSDNKVE